LDRIRRGFVAFPLALLATGTTAQPAPSRRLGVFRWDDRKEFESEYPGLFALLAERGWREGSTLALDWRRVRMDDPNLDAAAARLVAAEPHAILTESTRATRALHVATRTIPIVTSVGDPVASGFAASLARPGGNITGLALTVGAENKAIDIAREFIPGLSRVVLLYPSSVATSAESARQFAVAAARHGIETRTILIDAKDADRAAREAYQWGARAAFTGAFLDEAPTRRVADAAHHAGLATLSSHEQFGQVHAITVSVHHVNTVKSLVGILDKVLRGARPGEIAFEAPDSAKVIVNRRILAALGLAPSPALLLRATQVID